MRGKLHRSSVDIIIGGVCGGLAESFDIDPTIIRFGWALATVLGIGAPVLIYCIAWAIMPEE